MNSIKFVTKYSINFLQKFIFCMNQTNLQIIIMIMIVIILQLINLWLNVKNVSDCKIKMQLQILAQQQYCAIDCNLKS